MTLLLSVLLLFFLQSEPDTVLTPAVVAIITAVFTVVVGVIGVAVLRDRINANTRIKGLLGGLVTAYGMVAPFISSFPRWVGLLVAGVGLIVTLTSGRIQGPTDTFRSIVVFLCLGALLIGQTACGGPSQKTLDMLQAAGATVHNIVVVNAGLPEQLRDEHLIDEATYGKLRGFYDEFSVGVADIDTGLTAAARDGGTSLKKLLPTIADTIGRLRNLRSLVTNEKAQKIFGAVQLSLQVIGTYFAVQISRARAVGYSDVQICRSIGLPYERRRFELLAAGS